MSNVQETRGYYGIKGVIWGLNKAKIQENGVKRSISFPVQTSRDNTIYVQLGDWKNSKLNVKMRNENMEEVEEFNEQIAVTKLQSMFRDGDSVYINCRSSVDTYHKRLVFIVNQIYSEKNKIDFDSEDFEETNNLNQTIVISERPGDGIAEGLLTNYQGDGFTQEFKLIDEDIRKYFEEEVKVGDVIKATLRNVRKPIYKDSGEETERRTLKGKVIKTGGKGKKNIDHYESYLEIVDVDIEETEKKKYERSDIREVLEKTEAKRSKNNNTTNNNNNNVDFDSNDDDGDIPF